MDAVAAAGPIPGDDAHRAVKKGYSEKLSRRLAEEVAAGLRDMGFPKVKPLRGGPGEIEFQGGLGPKKVDVSYSDEQHGLMFAVSIKTICFSPFGKNLKNRFGDLCTEAITLHMRFPYSVVCALFAFPVACDEDVKQRRDLSTFKVATKLFATIGGRLEYTDPDEKFENVTMALFQPVAADASPRITLFDAQTGEEKSEGRYVKQLLSIYNRRNPHALIEALEDSSNL